MTTELTNMEFPGELDKDLFEVTTWSLLCCRESRFDAPFGDEAVGWGGSSLRNSF